MYTTSHTNIPEHHKHWRIHVVAHQKVNGW